MPEFSFYGWTAADLGITSIYDDLIGGGPVTVAGTPDTVTVSDGAGDSIFDDEPTQPTPDPGGDQAAFGDVVLDGVVEIANGAGIWNIGELTVTNATTGEVGTLVVFGDSVDNLIGMSSSIQLNVGDVLTFSNFVLDSAEAYDGLVCFANGTTIETMSGAVPVERLQVGKKVKTMNNGFQEIRWIGQRQLSRWDIEKNEKLRPVLITAGALGKNVPSQDLRVSRQHRMLIRSKVADRMVGKPEVLVAAIHLTGSPGIDVDRTCSEVVYYHLLFDEHEVIFANGAAAESLFTGLQALKSLSTAALVELTTIFPEVLQTDFVAKPAKLIPSNKKQRKMIERHIKNNKELVEPNYP